MKKALFALTLTLLASSAQAYSGEQYVTCNLNPAGDNWVALKAEADLKSKRLMKLGPNTYMVTLNPAPVGRWREVIVQSDFDDWSYSGPSGWVHVEYICRAAG
ncbi:MAG: hypothetical protein ACRBCL_07475 [Maritimibacter sp.]